MPGYGRYQAQQRLVARMSRCQGAKVPKGYEGEVSRGVKRCQEVSRGVKRWLRLLRAKNIVVA